MVGSKRGQGVGWGRPFDFCFALLPPKASLVGYIMLWCKKAKHFAIRIAYIEEELHGDGWGFGKRIQQVWTTREIQRGLLWVKRSLPEYYAGGLRGES